MKRPIDDTELKSNIRLHRGAAQLALLLVAFSIFGAVQWDGWKGIVCAFAAGLFCNVTINQTLKASVYLNALTVTGVIDEIVKRGANR